MINQTQSIKPFWWAYIVTTTTYQWDFSQSTTQLQDRDLKYESYEGLHQITGTETQNLDQLQLPLMALSTFALSKEMWGEKESWKIVGMCP